MHKHNTDLNMSCEQREFTLKVTSSILYYETQNRH